MSLNEPKPRPEEATGQLISQMKTAEQNIAKDQDKPPEKARPSNPTRTALNTGVQAGLSGALAMSLQVKPFPQPTKTNP